MDTAIASHRYSRPARLTSAALLLAFLPWFAAGCGRGKTATPDSSGSPPPTSSRLAPAKPPAPGPTVTDYKLKGVVRSIDKEGGKVLIRHEEIPGFMGKMTMPFSVPDREILEDLHPGDKVEGTLRVEQADGAVRDYHLLGLTVAEPAPPPQTVLDAAKGKVQIRQLPRRLEVGDAVPDFAMTDQDGKAVKLSDLRGKVVVLTFIYTRCPLPDFCPLMDRKFNELAQRISSFPARAGNIRLISLSFDPEHDTPDVLRKHARIRGAEPPLWTYAVASHDELAKIAAPLGLVYGPGRDEIMHNLCTAVIDRDGRLARLEVGTRSNRWETVDLLKTIYSLIPPTGR